MMRRINWWFFAGSLALATAGFGSVYSQGSAKACGPGDLVTVWSAETPTPGNGGASASQQIVTFEPQSKPATPMSVDGKFSGAPGAFEVDFQVAGTDSDATYQTCSNCNITTVDATNNTFHLDYNGTCRFARLLMRTRTNSVSITATITGG